MRSSLAPILALAFTAAPLAASAQTSSTNPRPPAEGATSVEPTPERGEATADAATEDRAPAQRPTPRPAPANLLDRIGQMFVMHGYFRVRPELMSSFALGWDNPALLATGASYQNGNLPWVRTPDNGLPNLCGTTNADGTYAPADCTGSTQTMANMRLRLNPEIHITDNISIHTQFDVFDNLILGSTPQGYYTGGQPSPWAPITAFSQTQVTPTPQNSLTPGITVSRAWAEVTNPTLGQIRFGRMPSQWGLGILANAGNGIDSDYQSHSDRLMYAARIRSLSLFLAGFYDFVSTGPTSQSLRYETGQGQPIDVSQLDDVHQVGLAVGRRVDPNDTRRDLARGNVVVNAGLYGLYRWQNLSNEFAGTGTTGVDQRTVGDSNNIGSLRDQYRVVNASAVIADGWFQLLHRNFRLELEAALIFGSTNIQRAAADTGTRQLDLRQFGGAMEFEYRLLNNRLQLEFKTGYATGDSDLEGMNYHNSLIAPQRAGATSNTLFRFHPDYRIDLILWRQIFRQVSGAYYFRPSVMYAFVDRPGGDRFYGRAAVIWSRASEFVQTRGNAADLGIEINAELTYQSNFRDTSLGGLPGAGFFASLQYGVLFPMAGLGPRDDERQTGSPLSGFSFDTAQTLRAILGVMY
ncbi:MAG: TIGR04551 family protein [Polyangiales bacterium]